MSLSLTKALETYAEKAAAMLAHIMGKALVEIQEEYVNIEEIHQQLSYMSSLIEEFGTLLHWRHDANSEHIEGNKLANKLANRGIVAINKPFLKNPKDQIKLTINILMAQLSRHIITHGPNINTTASSITNNSPNKAKIHYANIQEVTKSFIHNEGQKIPASGGVSIGGY